MTSRGWFPVAAILFLANLAGLAMAVAAGEPWHAAAHVGLAGVLGSWARRICRGQAAVEEEGTIDASPAEVDDLRQELIETREDLDFAERMLAEGREARAADRERWQRGSRG